MRLRLGQRDPIVLMLRLGTGLSIALSASLAAWLLQPRSAWTPPVFSQQSPASAASPRELKPLSDYAAIWRRNLRASLVDAPPPRAESVTRDPPPFQLAGTLVDADQPLAVFTLTNQASEVKRIGESVKNWEVLAIERGRVRIRAGDRELELRVPWYEQIARDMGANR